MMENFLKIIACTLAVSIVAVTILSAAIYVFYHRKQK